MVKIPGMDDVPGLDQITKKVEEKVDFPASKEEIMGALDNVPEIPDQVKEMAEDRLADKEYKNINEVKNSIGL